MQAANTFMYRTVIELVGNGRERELGEKELNKGTLQSEVVEEIHGGGPASALLGEGGNR